MNTGFFKWLFLGLLTKGNNSSVSTTKGGSGVAVWHMSEIQFHGHHQSSSTLSSGQHTELENRRQHSKDLSSKQLSEENVE